MKKTTMRIVATLFALALTLGMLCIPTLAADPAGSITINAPASGTVSLQGKTYTAYKVLNATTDGAGNYGYSITPEYANYYEFAGKTNAEIVNFIQGMNASQVAAFAKRLANYAEAQNIAGTAAQAAAGEESVTISNLDYGYYVVVETGSTDVVAACILNTVASDIEVTLKADVPEIDKTIVEGENYIKGTDVNIGDTVNFNLDSSVPDMTGYTTYTYLVTDTMSAGLTYDTDSIEVTIGATTYTYAQITAAESGFTYNTAPDAGTFTLDIDLLALGAVKNAPITITYSADLNENAVIGGAGNPNEVNLTYSNNPYDTTTETTPDSEVIVYTFKLDGTKVDGNDNSVLEGAEFSLYTTTAPAGAAAADKTIDGVDLYLVENGVTSDANGLFGVEGLSTGTYYLVEDVAPNGYNQLDDPIIFTVSATYDATTGTILTLEVDNQNLTATIATGSVATTVANNAGTILPSTGGIGTTIFIIAGLVLIVAAAALLLIKGKKTTSAK